MPSLPHGTLLEAHLPRPLYPRHTLTDQRMQDCGSNLLKLSWKKGAAPSANKVPLDDQDACVVCDDALRGACDVKHGRSYAVRCLPFLP